MTSPSCPTTCRTRTPCPARRAGSWSPPPCSPPWTRRSAGRCSPTNGHTWRAATHRLLFATRLAGCVEPLRGPAGGLVRRRWASEKAARVTGDRRLTARAVGKAALVSRPRPPGEPSWPASPPRGRCRAGWPRCSARYRRTGAGRPRSPGRCRRVRRRRRYDRLRALRAQRRRRPLPRPGGGDHDASVGPARSRLRDCESWARRGVRRLRACPPPARATEPIRRLEPQPDEDRVVRQSGPFGAFGT
ncbi:hypothetical protein SMICM304S_04365 [Streptomyces microflavus]